MAAALRKPATGDRVIVPDAFTDREHSGTVIDLLSVQFTYIDAAERVRFCFYSEAWKYDQNRRTQPKPTERSNHPLDFTKTLNLF